MVWFPSPDSPRHFENIEIYTDQLVSTRLGLTRAELVLVALLVGGDHSVSSSPLNHD